MDAAALRSPAAPAGSRPAGIPVVGPFVRRVAALVRAHRLMTGVAALYVILAILMPTRVNVAILDDWVYIRQAEDFARDLTLHIRDQAAANAIFDTIWGGSFAIVFGIHLWVFRLSTLVLSLIGGIGAYGLCRELGATKESSALGAALVLFNPLAFVLSYTFMTDAHLMTLVILSMWAYARGVRPRPDADRWIWIGSTFAALAYLSRPQGALLPLGVAIFFFITRRLRVDRAGINLLARIALIPAAAFLGHRMWLKFVNGVPHDQANFISQFLDSSVRSIGGLTAKLLYAQTVYFGLFLLPIAIGLVLALWPAARRMPRNGWILYGLFVLALAAGLLFAHSRSWRMPYLADWIGVPGLSDITVIGSRPVFLTPTRQDLLTLISVVGTLAIGLFVARAAADHTTPRRAEAGMVGCVLGLTMLSSIPPSTPFMFNVGAPGLDRYTLLSVPLAIALGVWACQGIKVIRPLVAAGVVAMVAFSFVGTRDSLVLQDKMWKMAEYANSIGIDNHELDGGAAWTRYHVSGPGKHVLPVPGAIAGWWITADWRTTAEYAVALDDLPGYEVLKKTKVKQWLVGADESVYLLRVIPRHA